MRKLPVLVVLAICLYLQPVIAQNREFPNAIQAKLNLIDYGLLNEDKMNLSQGFELGFTRNIAPFLNLGIPFKLGLAKLPGVKGNTVTTSLDVVFRLENMRDGAKVVPYFFGGVGYAFEDFDKGNVQFPFGGGLNFRVSKFAFVNLQGEYRKAQTDNRDNLQLGLGYHYLLHKSDPKQMLPPDADKDGVADAIDKCPNVPGPATAFGCPDRDNDGVADAEDACPDDPGPITTKGCPDYDNDGFADSVDECPNDPGTLFGCPDGDGDGVPDKLDKCPTEAGLAINDGCPEPKDSDGDGVPDKDDPCPSLAGTFNGCPDSDGDGIPDNEDRCPKEQGLRENGGCPVDTDGDGVADNKDKCPNVAGPVSNFGCPEVKKETKERLQFATKAVQFETGKNALKKESYPVLDEIVAILREYPAYSLSISGHTDNVGESEQNLKLSQDRAKACVDYLVFRGVDARRLISTGYGEAQPVSSNDTAEGRELNRRVVFEMVLQ